MIQTIIHLLLAAAAAFAISLVLTPPVRELMRALGIVDKPDPRRVNRVPVPRGGGIAVVIACFVTFFGVRFLWPELLSNTPLAPTVPYFTVSAILLVSTGFLDDKFNLPATLKLIVQIGVGLIMCYGGCRFVLPQFLGEWVNSPWVYTPLTVIWYVGAVNAFNLIDGLDGLSSGLAIIAMLGMAGVLILTHPGAAPVGAFILIGALVGFLVYNYNPASVFLGDSGSLFIGLSVASFALLLQRNDAMLITLGVPVLCLGVPLLDTMLAILRRTLRYIIRKKDTPLEHLGVMTADHDHLHHRFLAKSHGNQRKAVWGLYILAAVAVTLGFVTLALREAKGTVFLLGFSALAAVIIRSMADTELWDAGRLLSRPGSRCGHRTIVVPLYVLADVISMVALYLGLLFLLDPMLPEVSLSKATSFFLVMSVPVMLALVLAHSYVRIWGRATRKDTVTIFLAIFFASLISHLGFAVAFPEYDESMRPLHMLWAALLPIPVLLVRVAKTAFLQWLSFFENRRLRRASIADDKVERILFYGAGINLSAYLMIFDVNVTTNHITLLGVLDDNRGLRGRIFRDLPVFGSLEHLEADQRLMEKLRPTHIVVTTPAIGPERLSDIRAFCNAHNLRLTRFTAAEEEI